MHRRRFITYSVVYAAIFLMAILGLVFNIKSVAMNSQGIRLRTETQKLVQENQDLSLQIQEEERLDLLKEQALQNGYHFPTIVTYVSTPSANESKK